MALKRLQKEYMDLLKSPIPFGTVEPTTDPLLWKAFLNGPEDTPYDGYKFELAVRLPAEYPNRAPTVTFTTPIYHANVDANRICVSLFTDWRPTDTLTTILVALNNLLDKPNFESAYRGHISEMSRETYYAEAKAHTKRYALRR